LTLRIKNTVSPEGALSTAQGEALRFSNEPPQYQALKGRKPNPIGIAHHTPCCTLLESQDTPPEMFSLCDDPVDF
jgi:hypothetical protein